MKKYLKYIIILGVIIVFIIGLKFPDNSMKGTTNIVIDVTNYGKIYVELDADIAPITVTNFVKLLKEKFYDGLTFHRIITDFMIQGGDPSHNGTGGSKETIKGEFKENGVENNLSHKRGVISMARRGDSNDSASSQFFIMVKDNTSLDGKYAAFGKVTKGMEIVDKIVEDCASLGDSNGLVPQNKQPIIKSIRIFNKK